MSGSIREAGLITNMESVECFSLFISDNTQKMKQLEHISTWAVLAV